MFNIAIIGAGQIGSRHLQAISQIDRPVFLQVVDPDADSLRISQERYQQCASNGNVQGVTFHDKIDSLTHTIDLAVVATGAKVRRTVVETLLSKKKVRYLILEKVLFQRAEDLSAVRLLLKDSGVQAWVNCPFRMVPFYRDLQKKFCTSSTLDFSVSGSLIGIGCNSIHYLDLLSFFSGHTEFKLTNDQLDAETIPSKRPGFIEFTGALRGRSPGGSYFTMTSFARGDAPFVIAVNSDTVRCIIRENEEKCWISEAESGWVWQEIDFTIPYQSQMTHLAVQNIFDTGTCELPDYETSSLLHASLLEVFSSHLQEHSTQEDGICPIT